MQKITSEYAYKVDSVIRSDVFQDEIFEEQGESPIKVAVIAFLLGLVVGCIVLTVIKIVK